MAHNVQALQYISKRLFRAHTLPITFTTFNITEFGISGSTLGRKIGLDAGHKCPH